MYTFTITRLLRKVPNVDASLALLELQSYQLHWDVHFIQERFHYVYRERVVEIEPRSVACINLNSNP